MLNIDFEVPNSYVKEYGFPEIHGITANVGDQQVNINYQNLHQNITRDSIENTISGLAAEDDLSTIRNADEIVVLLSHGSREIFGFGADIDGVDISQKVLFEDAEEMTLDRE